MRTARAFSLVEGITVLAILAITAAIVGPKYANSLALYRAQQAAQRLAADLNLARWQAKATSAGQSIVFSGNTYSLPGYAGPVEAGATYTVNLAAEPYKATLSVGTVPTTVSFDRYGQPSAGGTFTISSGVATRTVTLDVNTGLAIAQ